VSQQINLYNPIFLKQKKYFSALTMLQSLGLILIGCALLVIYANIQLAHRTSEAAASATQLLKTKAQLVTVTTEFRPHQANVALDEDIKKAQTDISAVQHVFDMLQSGTIGNVKGYSGYFRAFARQIVDGLWLTGIDVHAGGREINLQGRALSPELVPVYLARLKAEPEMQGKSFATLDMAVPKENGADGGDVKRVKPSLPLGYIEFNLQSYSGAADTPAEGTKTK
jgi:Tfp pilus assembly protein PilN